MSDKIIESSASIPESQAQPFYGFRSHMILFIIIIVVCIGILLGIFIGKSRPQIEKMSSTSKDNAILTLSPTKKPRPTFPPSKGYDLWTKKYGELCQVKVVKNGKKYTNAPEVITLDINELGLSIADTNIRQISAGCAPLEDTFGLLLTTEDNINVKLTPKYLPKWYVEYLASLTQKYGEGGEDPSGIIQKTSDINVYLFRTLSDAAPPPLEQTGIEMRGTRKIKLSNGDQIFLHADAHIIDAGDPKLVALFVEHGELSSQYYKNQKVLESFDLRLLNKDFGTKIEKYSAAIEKALLSLSVDDILLTGK